ncbi:hypothetical protein PT974_02027 [Cladobotryum mycophilum]|uniref:Uncharacterized protein n=1 Tax=Cladobotryum mycophilum TaxID=491253 RepID=A0ABR0SX04_9HYPO
MLRRRPETISEPHDWTDMMVVILRIVEFPFMGLVTQWKVSAHASSDDLQKSRRPISITRRNKRYGRIPSFMLAEAVEHTRLEGDEVVDKNMPQPYHPYQNPGIETPVFIHPLGKPAAKEGDTVAARNYRQNVNADIEPCHLSLNKSRTRGCKRVRSLEPSLIIARPCAYVSDQDENS